jgi:integrase
MEGRAMRQRIFYDNDGNLCGEFAHDAEVGFIPHKRGLRRRLVSANECEKLGEAEAMTVAYARHAVKEKEIREKQFVKDESKTRAEYERKNITIKDAAKIWLDDVKTTLSKKTHSLYSKTIEIYLDNIENHRLQNFNRAHNMQFFTALESVKSPRGDKGTITLATQNGHMRQLSNFLHWAYKNEYLDRIIELKKARVPQKDMEVFSIKQLQTLKAYLLTNIDQNDSGREKVNAVNLYRAFMLATSCLMRSGAIYAQELKNIDLDKRIVKIRDVPALGWKNKASKWPNKPINDNFYKFLIDDLKSRGPKEKYFLDNGHGKTWYAESSAISKAMSKACKAANLPEGVKPFHWGMRAALITYLLNNGETPQKVQQLADHADIQTTMKYYNTREASQREAVARLPTI